MRTIIDLATLLNTAVNRTARRVAMGMLVAVGFMTSTNAAEDVSDNDSDVQGVRTRISRANIVRVMAVPTGDERLIEQARAIHSVSSEENDKKRAVMLVRAECLLAEAANKMRTGLAFRVAEFIGEINVKQGVASLQAVIGLTFEVRDSDRVDVNRRLARESAKRLAEIDAAAGAAAFQRIADKELEQK